MKSKANTTVRFRFKWCGKRDSWTYFAALNSAFANANTPVPLKRWRVCTVPVPKAKKQVGDCGKRDSWTYLALLDSAFASKRARTATSGSRVLPVRFPNEKKGNHKSDCLFSGAGNGTWTRTVWTTRPSNVRVCQFRHSRVCVLHATYYIIHDFLKMSSLFSKKMKIFSKKVWQKVLTK